MSTVWERIEVIKQRNPDLAEELEARLLARACLCRVHTHRWADGATVTQDDCPEHGTHSILAKEEMFHMAGIPEGQTFDTHTHEWYDVAGSPEFQIDQGVYTRQGCRVVGGYHQGQCPAERLVDPYGNEAPERKIRAFGRRS